MSYILDALRKAEQERQSQQTPDLHSVQGGRVAPRQTAAKWLWIGGVVVVIIAVNVAVWLWQSHSPADSDSTASAELQQPSSQQGVVPAASQRVEAEPTAVQPVAIAPAEQRSVQELWQVASHIKAAVQDLKFSFHVYSTKPQRRTIIINDHRMREGDKITADLTLEEITKDGVILAHPDTLVHVSILEQW
ncbi:MAG: general secretion pathway protein GspB [Pseudomonadales bacterium]